MTLFIQWIRDTRKSIVSIIIFGLIVAVAFGFIGVAISDFNTIRRTDEMIQALCRDGVSYLYVDASSLPYADDEIASGLYDYFLLMVQERKAGCIVSFADLDDRAFDEVFFITGSMRKYYEQEELHGLRISASSALYEKSLGHMLLNDTDYPLELAEEVCILAPVEMMTYAVSENVLLVFSDDFHDIFQLFPELNENENFMTLFLEQLTFYDITEEEQTDICRYVYENTGAFANIVSCESVVAMNPQSDVRLSTMYVVFYLVAFFVFPFAMLADIYVNLISKLPEYEIHNNFGASRRHVFLRMVFYAISYFVLPTVLLRLILGSLGYGNAAMLLSMLAFAIVGSLVVARMAFYRFCAFSTEGGE